MVLKPLTNFPLRSKENTRSPKQATKCKVFLSSFSQSVALNTWNTPLTTLFPLNDRKLSYKYFCFQKNFWKWSTAHVGYCFENHASLFCWKTKFFFLKFRNWLKKHIFQVNFPQFISLRMLIGGLTHLIKEICRKDKEITQTPKTITER